jgi:hypothetical protein
MAHLSAGCIQHRGQQRKRQVIGVFLCHSRLVTLHACQTPCRLWLCGANVLLFGIPLLQGLRAGRNRGTETGHGLAKDLANLSRRMYQWISSIRKRPR